MHLIRVAIFVLLALPAGAQWLNFPAKDIPRLADGSPDLSAPAPRLEDGRLDVSGIWMPDPTYISDITKDLEKGEVSMRPWAEQLYQHRRDTLSIEDPTGWCVPGGVPRNDAVPYPFKILNAKGEVVILYEAVHSFRQIFTDGRAHPEDPNPNWLGYSVGHWEDDAFLAETTGFVEDSWIDNHGHPGTNEMKVTERFVRKDFGHMDIEITIDDPKAYTKPWTVVLPLTLTPDDELLEYICSENNKDLEHLVGK